MTKKAIIIGSGFGGISTGIRLQAMGFETTILEKLDVPGGRAYQKTVKIDGIEGAFKFDMGPTVMTAPHFIEELLAIQKGDKFLEDYSKESLEQWEKIKHGDKVNFADLDNPKVSNTFRNTKVTAKYIQMVPITPFYRLFFNDGTFFDYNGNYEDTIEQIRKLTNDEEAEGFKKFHKAAGKVFERGFLQLGYKYFGDMLSMFKVVPDFIRLDVLRSLISYSKKYFKDNKTRSIFSFESLLVGGNPSSVPAIYVLIHFVEKTWGVHYAMGGTGKLIQALLAKFEESGGKILLNTPVDKILTENRKAVGVKLENGKVLKSDIVVSNADYAHTYTKLLKDETRYWNSDLKVKHLTNYSMSLVVVYFAFKKDSDPQKDHKLQHHNIVFGANYYEAELRKIFDTGELEPNYSQYLHIPTVTDPSMAPDGYHTGYTLICVPNKAKGRHDWSKAGPEYMEKVLKLIEEKGFIPNLKERLVHSSFISPDYFENTLNAHIGAAFGVSPLFRQSAFFRPHNRSEDIKNLYLAGSNTIPGAGVPAVMMSAKITAREIAKDFDIEV